VHWVRAGAVSLPTVDGNAAGVEGLPDPVVGVYDSVGPPLASNAAGPFTRYYGSRLDSFLRFLTPADDTYSVVVFGFGSGFQADPFDPGFQADPFDSASGVHAASEGFYELTMALESPVLVSPAEDDGAISLANDTGWT